MEPQFKIRFELDIDPRRYIQQVQSDNAALNERVEAGVKAALEEIVKDGYIETVVKNEVIAGLTRSLNKCAWSYDMQEAVSAKIKERINAGVEKYADTIVKNALAAIEKTKL